MQQISKFSVEKVREQFPALKRTYNGKQVVYFDGPGGSQVVQSAIHAITSYMENGGANLHGAFPTSKETEQTIAEAKAALADFLAVDPVEIVFGGNMTTLTLAVSRALAREWKPGDEIVVTEIDHRANVDPWIAAAEERGVTVRWIPVDPDTLTLNLTSLNEIINKNTRLVAVTLASNAVGTINDVPFISNMAKQVGALVAVDAVHGAPHITIDRDLLDADILLCSAYKFFGPHIGVAAIRKPLLERLVPYKLKPAPDYIPDKFETGTQNHEGIAGIKPVIDFFVSLGSGNTRRDQIVSGLRQIDDHESEIAKKIRTELEKIEKITLYQAERQVNKTPTIAFTVEGYTPHEVCVYLAEQHAIFVASGDFYASTMADKLGVNSNGGWIRAGLAPYNTMEEAERFVNALIQL